MRSRSIAIRMTNKMETKLKDLGIYELWMTNTQQNFNVNKVGATKDDKSLNQLYHNIQSAINNDDIIDLLTQSFNWCDVKEGVDFWTIIYKECLIRYDVKQ